MLFTIATILIVIADISMLVVLVGLFIFVLALVIEPFYEWYVESWLPKITLLACGVFVLCVVPGGMLLGVLGY